MRRLAVWRRSDIGTILLHWLVVITLTISVATGLRIAADEPEHAWLLVFDRLLPTVWTGHVPAALILCALAAAYAAYLTSARLPSVTGTYMRLAAFDHAQTHHTRHLRPILLELE
jgi:hypothetical protein